MNTVYLNGQFIPNEEAKISVMDRGFLFGDGVYEVIPVYGGRPLRLQEHLDRLQNSLEGIQLANPHSSQEWSQLIDEQISRNQSTEQALYLQITRGSPEKRDHAFPAETHQTVFIMSSPITPIPDASSVKGVRAISLDDIRWQNCHLKTVALLGNVLLKQEAINRGYDECVLLRDGYATECSASNLFMVKQGVLVTPPKSHQLLPGITRDLIVEVARDNNIEVLEREIQETELTEADELWFSSSTKAVVPIIELNDQPVGEGKPSELWFKVHAYYCDYIERLKAGELA